jgi:HEAT repeat protein
MRHDRVRAARTRRLFAVLALVVACGGVVVVHALFSAQQFEDETVRGERVAQVAAVKRTRTVRTKRNAGPAPEAVEDDGLAGLVSDPRPEVRRAAIDSLADRNEPSLARLLAPAVVSDDDDVRSDAIGALARLGGPGARVLLARADAHPRATAAQREEIRDALAALRRNAPASPGLPSADFRLPGDPGRPVK